MTVALYMLVGMAMDGHVQLYRLLTPTTCISILWTSTRQATAIVGTVFPSAASTQVVPNGKRKSMRDIIG